MTDESEQERWTDEEIAEAGEWLRENQYEVWVLIRKLAAHAYKSPDIADIPDVAFRWEGKLAELLARRLRGGEGERDEVKKRFDRIHAHDATGRNRLARALDVSPEQDVADVWREIERKVDSLLSPTDGEEGPGADLRTSYIRHCQGQLSPGEVSDAAPDTEGREEGGLCTCDPDGPPMMHEPDCEYGFPGAADARPEEAGGEDVLEGMEPEPVTNLHQRIKVAVDKRGPYDGAVTLTVPEAVWLADRLRGAPEGAGEGSPDTAEEAYHRGRKRRLRSTSEGAGDYNGPEIPEGVLWSVAAAMDEAWHSGYWQARDDLRTGRKGRDE